jgi:hypothetical protein
MATIPHSTKLCGVVFGSRSDVVVGQSEHAHALPVHGRHCE